MKELPAQGVCLNIEQHRVIVDIPKLVRLAGLKDTDENRRDMRRAVIAITTELSRDQKKLEVQYDGK